MAWRKQSEKMRADGQRSDVRRGPVGLQRTVGRRAIRPIGAWWGAVVDLCFPPTCLACGSEGPFVSEEVLLCELCCQPWYGRGSDVPRCGRCAIELPSPPVDATVCSYCRHWGPAIDRGAALGWYQERLRGMMLATKRPRHTALARSLGQLLAERVAEQTTAWGGPPQMVVPVPMHWTRRTMRGVNAAERLAYEVGRRLCVPALRAVRRIRNTATQHGLTRSQRWRNVRGAFAPAAGYDFDGLRVLIVDDILTTGATASEVARVLKRRKASWIGVAVAARTPPADWATDR